MEDSLSYFSIAVTRFHDQATHKRSSLIQSLRPSWQGTRPQAGSHSAGAGAIAKSLINKQEAERANWERCGLLKFKPSDTPPLKHSSQPFLNSPTNWGLSVHMYELMKIITLIQTTTRTRTVSDPREYCPTLLLP